MNIVLINLTRFGDQLQSQAAINALAELDGGSKICLITLANFASSSVFLSNISMTYPLPKDAFMDGISTDWPAVASRLWEWRRELEASFKPDMICNITPSVSARLLGRFLAGGRPYTGYGLDEFGFGTASSWAAFFQGSSRRREVSPFNLVDLFRAVAGNSHGKSGDFKFLAPPADSAPAKAIRAMLPAATGLKGFVAFQLGASEERRRWPVEYFAELGREIWNNFGYMPMLLGGKGEENLAAHYAELSAALDPKTPHLSLIGRTGLQELAAALMQAKLLVSNDTGTMHLAAGLGCPVLGIFLATAQPWDTGPYLENSCSLEPGLACHPCPFGQSCPHDEKCRRAIGPDAVTHLCLGFLRDGKWPEADSSGAERPRVWLALRDEFGFMDLASLSAHENEPRTLWFREQRRFLRQFLDRKPDEEFNYAYSNEKFKLPPEEQAKISAELDLLSAQLKLLVELGEMLQTKPLPVLQERFIAALHKASMAFESSRYLLALGLLWQVEVQEKGDELAAALVCIKQYQSLISSLIQMLSV